MVFWNNKRRKQQEKNTDVVIIGGGLSGLLCAYHLVKNKKKRVTLLERSFLGAVASGRNAGFLTTGSTFYFYQLVQERGLKEAKKLWKLSQKSRKNLFNLARELGLSGKDLFLCEGKTWFLKQEKELSEKVFQTMRDSGLEKISLRKGEDFFEHILENEGSIHPVAFIQKLVSFLKDKGVTLVENCNVFSYENEGKIISVHTSKSLYKAHQLILATNAYLSEWGAEFSHIRPTRAQCAYFQGDFSHLEGIHYFPREKMYFKKLSSSELILGGARSFDFQYGSGASLQVSPLVNEKLLDFSQRFLSSQSKLHSSWVGLMAFQEDCFPLVKKLPHKPIWALGAYGGHGIALSYESSRLIIQQLLK